MEHIVQFGINIDDQAIVKSVARAAQDQLLKEIKLDVLNKIFKPEYYHQNADPKHDPLSSGSQKLVQEVMEDWKPEIIAASAKLLAEKLVRTKAVREAAAEVVKEKEEKLGHWEAYTPLDDMYTSHYKCSVCGRIVSVNNGTSPYKELPYCNCGAKMDEEEK